MLRSFVKGLFYLINPPLCIACRQYEPFKEEDLCLSCLKTLPLVASPLDATSATVGKEHFPADLSFFYSLFYYTKDGLVADMIHRIKYNGQYRLARKLGKLLGDHLKSHKDLTGYCIVPVPIHKKRRMERGFNQSEELAKGIRQSIPLSVKNNLLVRTQYEKSQTAKDKYARAELLKQSFTLNSKEELPIKILLVDDVVTTGSTLESCVELLSQRGINNIAVATLGISI